MDLWNCVKCTYIFLILSSVVQCLNSGLFPQFNHGLRFIQCQDGSFSSIKCRPGNTFNDCAFRYRCEPANFKPYAGHANYGVCCPAPPVCPYGIKRGPYCGSLGQCPMGYSCFHGICCQQKQVTCPAGTYLAGKCDYMNYCQPGFFCSDGACCSIPEPVGLKIDQCPVNYVHLRGLLCNAHHHCPGRATCVNQQCCEPNPPVRHPAPRTTPPTFPRPMWPPETEIKPREINVVVVPKPPTEPVPTIPVVPTEPPLKPLPPVQHVPTVPPYKPPPPTRPPILLTMAPPQKPDIPPTKPPILPPTPPTSPIQPPSPPILPSLPPQKSIIVSTVPPNMPPIIPPDPNIVVPLEIPPCPADQILFPEIKCDSINLCPGNTKCIDGLCCGHKAPPPIIPKAVAHCPPGHDQVKFKMCNVYTRCPAGSQCINGACCRMSIPTPTEPPMKLLPVEPPEPALPPVIPKKPAIPPVTPVKPVLPPVTPIKPVLPPVTPVKPVLPPSPEVVEPAVMIPKPACGVGFTEVPGVTCDATVPCPIGSQCVSGICCALFKPPVEPPIIVPTDSQPLQKLPPVEPPQPALPPVILKKPVLPPVTPVKPVLPPVMPVKPVLPPVTPVKPVLPPSPEVVEPPVLIPKPTCGVGFTEVPGVTCDATVPCPIGSQCVSGICCALIKPPVEKCPVKDVPKVCPEIPDPDQCMVSEDCGPFVTCCETECGQRVCQLNINPLSSRPRKR